MLRKLQQVATRCMLLYHTTMTEWTPISESELYDQIQKAVTDLNGELWDFWQLIKIVPVKWSEKEYGD